MNNDAVNAAIEHLDDHGFDVNGKGDHGRSILHVVATSGHQAYVGKILNVPGVDVNCQDEDGKTPLHLAICKGHKEIVELLLRVSNTDVNLKDKDGAYPLHWAATLGYGRIVEKILKVKNGDVNCIDNNGMTPLHWVAKITTCNSGDHSDRMSVVEKILAEPNVDANKRDSDETSPFIMATMHKQYAIGEKILNRLGGEFLNSLRGHDGDNPLHWAATNGNVTVVEMILKVPGVDMNCEDYFGNTPLHLAAMYGHSEVVDVLLRRRGVSMNCKDTTGMTPLHWATAEGHHAVVRTLSLKIPEVDVNNKDEHGKTPLHLAVEKGHEAVVEEILKLPADQVDLETEDSEKLSPLHLAIKTNQQAIVQVFLKILGEDHFMEARFRDGRTPMYMAAFYEHEQIVKTLSDSGVLKDAYGMTPLHCASVVGLPSLVKRLLNEAKAQAEAKAKARAEAKPKDVNFKDDEEEAKDYVNCQDNQGRTPLHLAVSGQGRSKVATVEEMLRADKVEMNCVDANNQTPLHFAVLYQKEPNILSILLRKKENIRLVEDINGKTALQYAFETENKETFLKYLSESPIGKAYKESLFGDRQVYVDASNAILVGAALIASVTFASWLQPPLGYSTFYEETLTNPYPGPPTSYPNYVDFEHHKALQAFWIFNSLSFFFATSTVVFGARSVLPMPSIFIKKAVSKIRFNLLITTCLLFFSILFGIISFSIAGYIVIPPKLKFQANIFGTVAVGGLVCLTSLGFLAGSIVQEFIPLFKKLYLRRRRKNSNLE